MHLRIYMFAIGTTVLVALYFDWAPLLYGVGTLTIFEGFTGLTLTRLLGAGEGVCPALQGIPQGLLQIPFEATRMWRLMVGGMLLLSYGWLPDVLWFIPWFIGFAVTGAGLSGVCPVLMLLKAAGFR